MLLYQLFDNRIIATMMKLRQYRLTQDCNESILITDELKLPIKQHGGGFSSLS